MKEKKEFKKSFVEEKNLDEMKKKKEFKKSYFERKNLNEMKEKKEFKKSYFERKNLNEMKKKKEFKKSYVEESKWDEIEKKLKELFVEEKELKKPYVEKRSLYEIKTDEKNNPYVERKNLDEMKEKKEFKKWFVDKVDVDDIKKNGELRIPYIGRKHLNNCINYSERVQEEDRIKRIQERDAKRKKIREMLSFLNNNARYFKNYTPKYHYLKHVYLALRTINHHLKTKRGKKFLEFRRQLYKFKRFLRKQAKELFYGSNDYTKIWYVIKHLFKKERGFFIDYSNKRMIFMWQKFIDKYKWKEWCLWRDLCKATKRSQDLKIRKRLFNWLRYCVSFEKKYKEIMEQDKSSKDIFEYDSAFSLYRERINRWHFNVNKLKLYVVKKELETNLKCIRYEQLGNLFTKRMKKDFKKVVKNEILFISPEFFYIHKKAKSWTSLKSKRRRRLRHVKKIKVGSRYNNRQLYDLKMQLNKIYYWLLQASKLQTSLMLRDYNRDIKKDKIKNYYRIKKFYFKKKSRLLRFKRKDLYRFLKRKRKYNLFFFNKFFKVFKKYVLFFSLIKNKLPLFFFKFYFLRFIYSFLFFFKKANINKKLKYILRKYTSKLLLLRKAKFRSKLKPNVRRKIRFYYDLVYTNKYKVYKLKVKMVNSNFFITLTDPNDKVIISRSTGHVAENRKKKVKLSPYLVTNMMYLVLSILRKLKIKYLNIFINTKINRHINNVVKSLQDARHTRILKIFFSKPIPHHFGTRKPKLRRL